MTTRRTTFAASRRFSEDELNAVRGRIGLVGLIGRYVKLTRKGAEYEGLCPFHHEKTPSFGVNEAKGFYHCFGCGAHGDVIAFYQQIQGVSFREAVEAMMSQAGLDDPQAAAEAAERERRARLEREAEQAKRAETETEAADRLWSETLPAAGSLVEVYLRSRGIRIPPPPVLRFHPALGYWHPPAKGRKPVLLGKFPAMVARVQSPNGAPVGVHITYLAADGGGKARIIGPGGEKLAVKKMRGRVYGGAIHLTPIQPKMGLGEGVETAMSVFQVRPNWGVWAGLSIGNMAGAASPSSVGGWHPRKPDTRLPSPIPDPERPGLVLPGEVSDLVLLAERANGDQDAYEALLKRAGAKFAAAGHRTSIAWPDFGDFNDALTGQI